VSDKIRAQDLSSLFAGFLLWIKESCAEKRIKRLFFLTREGEFFKKVYDEIAHFQENKEQDILVDILEVSRVATFAPSINAVEIEEFLRMWSLYKEQSPQAFFSSIGMEAESFAEKLRQYHLNETEVISSPHEDKRVVDFLADKDVKRKIMEEITTQREKLKGYFRQKGIPDEESDEIAVVDIGWRGTIQDNLCRIYPNIQWTGYYLCLASFLNEQPVNGHKFGYLNQGKTEVILRYPTPMEMICNSSSGSVSRYQKNGGRVEAIRIIDEDENRTYHLYTENLQTYILNNIRKCFANNETKEELLSKGNEAVDSFLLCPSKQAAAAFFALKHNETFGNGKFVDKAIKIKGIMFVQACFSKEKRKQLKCALWETTWPQGYLVWRHMRGLVPLYNYILERNYLK